MDAVLRGVIVFGVLLILTRLLGRRTLGEMTPFDFVLLLIISEATQEALIGDDFSATNSFIVIATLIGTDIALSYAKDKSSFLERWLDGTPTVLVERGKLMRDKMKKARIDEEDILGAAREKRGLGSLKEIDYAILESTGEISIIPVR